VNVAAPQLDFFPEDHRYVLDGQTVPSVTQILSFGQDLSRIPAWTAHRGTAFHLATEYWDASDLDMESIDPQVKPHFDAYVQWWSINLPNYTHTEERVWAELDGMLYCGTIDRIMLHRRGHHVVLDLKSGAPRAEHGLQLAAYKHAVMQRMGFKDVSCVGLYCTKDGKWLEKPYDQPHLLEGFRAKLRNYYEAMAVQTPQTTEA